MKNATFVLTDSFHCSAFAIRYHRPFYTLQRFSNRDVRGQNSRIESLLQLASFEDRLVVPGCKIDCCQLDNERFKRPDLQMNQEIVRSRRWLEMALAESTKNRLKYDDVLNNKERNTLG